MGAMVTQAPGRGAIRFRPTWGQWAWLAGSVSVAVVLAQAGMVLVLSGTSGSAQFDVSFAATFCAVFAVGTAIIFRWQGVTLTPQGLHVRSLYPRVIAWPYIDSFRTSRLLGTTYLIVQETSGRRTRLRAPYTGLLAWDRDFDTKYQTLAAWHQALRG